MRATALLDKRATALPEQLMLPGHDGTVQVSFSAGVTKESLADTLAMGVRPATVCSDLLKPGGFAFITGALTAAQVDHIYEYRYESELVAMCENAGLRVLETLSANPLRTLPKARFLPRSMALFVQKRRNDLY